MDAPPGVRLSVDRPHKRSFVRRGRGRSREGRARRVNTQDPDGLQPLPGLAFTEGETPQSPWRRRLLIGGVALTVLLLAATAAGATYVAWTNKDRADRWEARAAILERNVAALDEAVITRTEDLNERTSELNRMAAIVKKAEHAIKRSEADVKNLERRQRALAAEKAEVEDARAALALEADALEAVAQAYVDCKTGLVELLNYVLDDDYYSAGAVVGSVRSDCDSADASLDGYLATFG